MILSYSLKGYLFPSCISQMLIIWEYTLLEGHLQPLEAGGRQLLWRGNCTAWLIQQDASPSVSLEYPALSEPGSGKASTLDSVEAFKVCQRKWFPKNLQYCLSPLLMWFRCHCTSAQLLKNCGSSQINTLLGFFHAHFTSWFHSVSFADGNRPRVSVSFSHG